MRYFLATFIIIEKKVKTDRRTKKKYIATKKSETEAHALRIMRLLHKDLSDEKEELDEDRTHRRYCVTEGPERDGSTKNAADRDRIDKYEIIFLIIQIRS